MSQIILDFSANTFCNSFEYAKQMMDEIKVIDTGKHQIIFKTQLFKSAPPNIPLDWSVFDSIYHYGKHLGYQVTSSVFDKESLDFLLQYEVPMIKIANNRNLYWLIKEVPRKIPVYVSIKDCATYWKDESIIPLCCVSNYPSNINEYEKVFVKHELNCGISDHTTDFQLWNKYQPNIIEWHFKLPNSQGLDSGPFSRTPQQLAEVL